MGAAELLEHTGPWGIPISMSRTKEPEAVLCNCHDKKEKAANHKRHNMSISGEDTS